MSLSRIIVTIIGIILALVGLALILSAIGVSFLGISLTPWWVAVIVGVLCLGGGIYIIRGGTPQI